MEPLIHSMTLTLAQDVRELVHAPLAEAPALLEKDPPNWRWHWHLPLGFVSLAAAGLLLVAAGGVQSQVQQRQHGAKRERTRMHKQKVHRLPPTPRD